MIVNKIYKTAVIVPLFIANFTQMELIKFPLKYLICHS